MRYILIIILGVLTTSFQFQSNVAEETVNLKIVITNINTIQGNMVLGLFNNSNSFLTKGEEFRAVTEKVTDNTMIIRFNNIPKGVYAFSMFHDMNSDGKCNLSMLARPVEPIGFSNNIKLKFFKPSYESCKFNLHVDRVLTTKLTDI